MKVNPTHRLRSVIWQTHINLCLFPKTCIDIRPCNFESVFRHRPRKDLQSLDNILASNAIGFLDKLAYVNVNGISLGTEFVSVSNLTPERDREVEDIKPSSPYANRKVYIVDYKI